MNDNIAIGIMTSINLRSRYMACKDTWTKEFDNVFFFGGDAEDENLIRLPGIGEDYSSAFMKQQLGLKYMFEKNNEFDWFSMNGCDHMLFKKEVMETLKAFDRNKDILIGEVYKKIIIDGIETNLFAGGGSFFMSNSLMKKIYPKIEEFNKHWIEITSPVCEGSNVSYDWADVAIAYIVKKYTGVDPTYTTGMYSQHPEFYKEEIMFKPLSFHYIKPSEMERIYQEFR